MTEEEFTLQDRITKIQAIEEKYNLQDNSYLSFSGGKDSAVLSSVLDEALLNNTIPRVFFNTGIEITETVKYVKNIAGQDPRVIIVNAGVDIRAMLQKEGYPFKSKLHSQVMYNYQKNGLKNKSTYNYLVPTLKVHKINCPDKLYYQFTPSFSHLKCSQKCCYRLKKDTAKSWEKENNKSIVILGVRTSEGGLRAQAYKGSCVFYNDKGELNKFTPFAPVEESFIDYCVDKFSIKLFPLYYPPYNFERTGCKGCPYAMRKELRKNLLKMAMLLPGDFKSACRIWEPVYREYIKLGWLPKRDWIMDYGYDEELYPFVKDRALRDRIREDVIRRCKEVRK